MKRYMLTEAAFIGGALLAAGSFISDADLPEAPKTDTDGNPLTDDDGDPTGEMYRSPPPASSIEVDENHQPVKKAGKLKVAASGIPTTPVEVAPVAPHAPNPTAPQAIPPHGPGEIAPAGDFVPAQGAESDDAAQARADQADAIAGAAARASGSTTAPKRRGA